ncbi:polysaccharide pyruvyl transferase family protein [Lutibacter sp. TH_r2]|uniref:polysaccharide pyruvyl transferase family protein n=1 Tax=Lutibacter sp. TH_r2 TaxID=3082083 RepID=UPI002955151A|nr:polysaccharide pyruvyl transferase family protein [Lutibacter sp. TH_r2]MDV7187792.1 polysaccharide pyruvyl transferase family protein [Lutibacter sp. TH_r2]
MKIGQLTLPFNWNYGGILQGYALKTTLKDLGHDSIIISRRRNRDNSLIRLLVWIKWETIKLASFLPIFRILPLVSVECFKRKYIKHFTPNIYTDKSLKEVVNKYNFKGYVVGSDQIWNYTAAPHINDAFLDFVSDKNHIKRVSYAASFGKDSWQYPDKETKRCKDLVKKFDAVSVREKSGVTLCNQFLEVNAQHQLDPTMLLKKDDYINIIKASNVSKSNGKLLLYILDNTASKQEIANKVASELSIEPYGIRQFRKIQILQNAIKGIYPSIEQWLKSFYDAEFVVTDSFHGTIFAIIFNKPFITVANKERGMARFESLLKDLGLADRLINQPGEINKGLIYARINWNTVNKEIDMFRQKGIEFLKNNFK